MYYRTREQDRLAKSVVANKQASLSARSTPIKATKAHSMSFHEFSPWSLKMGNKVYSPFNGFHVSLFNKLM